jgi:hypothetical protein
MTRYLLDTGIMGHFINHRQGPTKWLAGAERESRTLATSPPIRFRSALGTH